MCRSCADVLVIPVSSGKWTDKKGSASETKTTDLKDHTVRAKVFEAAQSSPYRWVDYKKIIDNSGKHLNDRGKAFDKNSRFVRWVGREPTSELPTVLLCERQIF